MCMCCVCANILHVLCECVLVYMCIENDLKVKRKVKTWRSFPLLSMCLHFPRVAITTCIFFGLSSIKGINAKYVYSITSHFSFRM